MKQNCWRILFVLSILLILFGISNIVLTDVVRGVTDKKAETVYQGYRPSLGDISDIVCDTADNIYVIGMQMDCLTVFTPDGKVIYSYLFPSTLNGEGQLVALQDGSVVVDYPGVAGRYIFRSDMTVSKTPTPSSYHENLFEDYDAEKVYMIAGSEVKNSKGETISRSWASSQIYRTDLSGKKERIAGNSLLQWLTSAPLPSGFWIGIGMCSISYLIGTKENWLSTNEPRRRNENK